MKTSPKADARFLRGILFALIFATFTTGGIVTYTSVKANQVGEPNFTRIILAAK